MKGDQMTEHQKTARLTMNAQAVASELFELETVLTSLSVQIKKLDGSIVTEGLSIMISMVGERLHKLQKDLTEPCTAEA